MEAAKTQAEIKAGIDALLGDVTRLPPMPAMVARLNALVANPEVDMKALAEEISHDPAITAAIIRLSNSAYYRPSRAIRSVHEAIVTLGLRVVKNIVVVAASKGILKVDLDSYKMEAPEMWDHSLVVAELAASIARLKKRSDCPEDVAFTAGLLHDVGKVILVQYFHRVFLQIIADMERQPGTSFTDLERKYTGYSHDEVGAALLERWSFPAELVEAVRYNYHPDRATVNPGLCSMVHIANVIALSAGIGIDIGGLNEQLNATALQTLSLSDRELEALYGHLPEFLEKLSDLRSL
jgi:putative nucleotidyltransferase with HDIG domain